MEAVHLDRRVQQVQLVLPVQQELQVQRVQLVLQAQQEQLDPQVQRAQPVQLVQLEFQMLRLFKFRTSQSVLELQMAERIPKILER